MRPSPVLVKLQEEQRKEVPTLREFAPRVIAQHARANRQKASTIHAKERIFENHLYPALGNAQLDRATDDLVQVLKANLSIKAPKTVNNILTVLGKTLRLAVKWKVSGTMPCTIDLLRVRIGQRERVAASAVERVAEVEDPGPELRRPPGSLVVT